MTRILRFAQDDISDGNDCWRLAPESRSIPAMQTQSLRRVIIASSVGTVIEFYDFFIFASLASTIAAHFFPPDRPTLAFMSTLATYGIGLAVRPFGSLAFGRLGDTAGRKTTFLITLVMMGTATAAIGVLPGYATLGVMAPVLLITLRVIQGLALGGEYAGAATYVGRTCSGGETRVLHGLHPAHADDRAVRVIGHRARDPLGVRRSGVHRLGMAPAIPHLGGAGGDLVLYPRAARGVSGIRRDEAAGKNITSADSRELRDRRAMEAVRGHP